MPKKLEIIDRSPSSSGGHGARARRLLPLALSALLAAVPAASSGEGRHDQEDHRQHQQHLQSGGLPDALNVEVELHDLELLNEDGERVRLKSDVIGDKLVAMTFTYTTCTTICPIYGALFQRLQGLLGDRLGREVVLVTMTLDPARDVPQRMKREALKYRAKPGWVHLTGEKEKVDKVLRGLDAYFADFTQHPPMALAGDGVTGIWKRINGFPRPQELVHTLDELQAARGE